MHAAKPGYAIPSFSPRQKEEGTFRIRLVLLASVALLGSSATAFAQKQESPVLADLTFEQLSQIEVTSVSHTPNVLWKTPAAVTVLTRENLEQSGATSIPEALQWVPGLNVAQINSNTWAIGARGFQWQYANKLLVMVDGRSVYSPSSGGVRWEDNMVLLDDLDRIEVVRGPGSSVWGANAVNGVISIVSRSAFDTLGTHVFAGGGNELTATSGVRYGAKISDNAAVRFYGMYRFSDDNRLPAGLAADDSARFGQTGFRLDWKPSATNTLTLQGDFFVNETEYQRTLTTLTAPSTYSILSDTPIRSRGANVLGRWRREWGESSYIEWQNYWDWVYRNSPQHAITQHTLDSNIVGGTRLGDRHEITAGLGYRHGKGRQDGKLFLFDPENLTTHLFSAFLQDQISLVPERWTATLGTKIEHNSFTGWEPQPTARIAYTPSPDISCWASIARAVRTPTWLEETAAFDALVFPPGVFDPVLPASIRIFGNPNLKSEKLTSYELGARWKLAGQVSVEASAFSYDYSDYVLVSYTSVTNQTLPPAQILASRLENGIKGESYGGEIAVRWKPAEWWQMLASYSYVQIQLHTMLSDPFSYEEDEGTTPDHVVRLQSTMRLNPNWTLNLGGRYVDRVPYYSIHSYVEMDANLTWKPSERWQISLIGRNLVHAHHPEYDSALNRRLTEIQRSVFLQAKWNY